MAVLIGALGDIHGDFASTRRIMQRHSDVHRWVCVGDLADEQGRYEPVDAPLYFIKGNNESFDLLASGGLPENLHYLPSAVARDINGLIVAGLGGTLAPTWYDTPAAELPHPKKATAKATELADKRRHFVREEVDACRKMHGIDIFLSHEAPRPFFTGPAAGASGSRTGNDAGKTPINEILGAMRPRLHLFGHHHRFSAQQRQGVPSVGLDLVSRSYLLIDADTLAYEHIAVPGS